MKPYVVDLNIGGKIHPLNINNRRPRIVEINVESRIRSQIQNKSVDGESNTITKTKNNPYNNFLLNQTYDMTALFANLPDGTFGIVTTEYSAESSATVFKIVRNYLCMIDTISQHVCAEFIADKNPRNKMSLNVCADILSVCIPSLNESDSDTKVEVIICGTTSKHQREKIRDKLIETYGKNHIT